MLGHNSDSGGEVSSILPKTKSWWVRVMMMRIGDPWPRTIPRPLEGGHQQACQPANQPTPLRFDFTPSSPESHPQVTPPPPPPPPHLMFEAPTAPPSHLIRWKRGFSPAHVRAGQAFEAQIPWGARVNLHSLKARICCWKAWHWKNCSSLYWLSRFQYFWLWNQLLSKSGSSNGSSLQDHE